MDNVKIIEQLTEDTFVVKITKAEKLKQVGIAYDFVQFIGTTHLTTEKGSVTFDGHTSNVISVNSSVQIPIRMFKKFVLPYLNKHKNLQDEHLADRQYSEDDKLNNPPTAIQFYCNVDKEHKVAVLDKGDREPNIISLGFYNKYIKPNIR